MEGFDFFGLAAKESREPETRELPRRILFRGKLKSGEWASGNLNVDSKGICIIRPGKNVVGKYGRVNPETVGQATGILDKLARDIFEGDILKIHHKTPLPVGLAVVKYDKKRSAFRAFPVDRPWYACRIAYPDEIVGNIYDDPDLLKQGEDTQNDEQERNRLVRFFMEPRHRLQFWLCILLCAAPGHPLCRKHPHEHDERAA